MEKITVVKVGGKIVEDETQLVDFLTQFNALPGLKLLVHGGGRLATTIGEKMGLKSTYVDGRRVTDAETLNLVTMVYGGLVNKNIVAKLQAMGVNSIGLTGADMNLIEAHKRVVEVHDYGFAGDVDKVNADLLAGLIEKKVVPVLAPLTHDGQGGMLNTNADTIAAEVAKALSEFFEVSLVYCFEKPGVLLDENDNNSVIPLITKTTYKAYKIDGIINGGMIPKLDNAFMSIRSGVKEVVIKQSSSLAQQTGTTIR